VPGRDAVTILSYGMWKQAFGGDASVLGQKIHIAGVEFTVIGVAPERFTGIDPRPLRESAFGYAGIQARYDNARSLRFFEDVVDDARHLRGVRVAGLTSAMPFSGPFTYLSVVPDAYRLANGETAVHTWSSSIDEQYFQTMGMTLLAGRGFHATDTADATRVAIVNDTFARHYWPDGNIIGRRFRIADAVRESRIEVVGVVKTTETFYPGEPAQEIVHFPFRQEPRGTMVLLAETAADSGSALAPLRDIVWRMDADVPVHDVQTIETFYEPWYAGIARSMLGMIGGMGVIGVTLTVVGLYGLVSYAVSRRTRELGIRIAVGASYHRVLGMVLRQGMAPACAGLIVGFGLSVMTARLLPTLIPMNEGYSAIVVIWLMPVLLSVTLFAAFVPARRAARVDPTVALRCD
jgi:putative ABC transport system permease protein